MKILFITSNRLGDAVLSTGVLSWLVGQYPHAQFTIACGPHAAGLFRAVPRLERLIVLEKKSWNRHWLALWQDCIGTRWDIILDLRNSLVSHLLRRDRRASRPPSIGQHKVIENAKIREHLFKTQEGSEGGETHLALPEPHIWLDTIAEKDALRLLPAAGPLLALGPAANWPCKQWPTERFAALAQRLTAESGPMPNAPVLIIASEHERTSLLPLLKTLPEAQRIEIIGQDLLTVAACLKQAQLFIGNDSGLMHMAAAMGTRTLGLFGPGDENVYGPWGNRSAVARTTESREVLRKRLSHPNAHEPNLMEGLSVEKALDAATKLLTVPLDNPVAAYLQ